MIRNYIKLTIRNLTKNKLFSAIKLFGLTIGLTACLLIGLYIHHELSYDKHNVHADRIARITMEYSFGGDVVKNISVTGNKVGPSFASDFPEIEEFTRVIKFSQVVKYEDKLFEEENFYFADSSIFNIFTIPLIHGDALTALNEPNEVVISSIVAEKYFGNVNPVGKEITVSNRPNVKISGVYKAFPTTSQLQADFIGSFLSLPDSRPERSTWWSANYATYVLLNSETDVAFINRRIPDYMNRHTAETEATGDSYLLFHLEPLLDVHLRSEVPENFQASGDIRYIYLLAFVGFLVLLIGSTTYINLTAAIGTKRATEIGVQKVLGASKTQLFSQHLCESFFLTGFAFIASYIMVIPLIPFFNKLIDRDLTLIPLASLSAILMAFSLAILISFLSGVYPALMLSNYRISNVLKGKIASSSKGWLQNSLIVFQFAVSVLLIICTGVLNNQLGFIQNKKLGYNKDQVLVLPADANVINKLNTVKSEFSSHTNILSVSLAYETPVKIDGGYGISLSADDPNGRPVRAIPVDEDFVETLDIVMLAGKELDKNDVDLIRRQNNRTDTTSTMPILINETLAKEFGWSADQAINKFVQFQSRAQIKGVFSDFHFESLHEPIGTLVIFPSTWGRTLLVRLGDSDLSSTLSFLEKKWSALVPHRPFNYHFMDEEFGQMYGAEARTARFITTFSMIAILLAFLGLFALASFSIVQRTKEIGIRKVLGASITGIVGLLAVDFLKLVLISLLIASPIAWYFMNSWLTNFTYRIDLSWEIFALAGFAAISIAFGAICFQSMKAALANPTECLRRE